MLSLTTLDTHVQANSNHNPLLSVAVNLKDKATVAALIEAGADVNACNDVRAIRFCTVHW
jgi:ankyrin repeat protein